MDGLDVRTDLTYAWIGHSVGIFVMFVHVLTVLFRKSNSVWMDWTYAWIGLMHRLDTVLVSIFVVFVRVLIVLFRKSNSACVRMDWKYAWIGHSVGKYFCHVCSCINSIV